MKMQISALAWLKSEDRQHRAFMPICTNQLYSTWRGQVLHTFPQTPLLLHVKHMVSFAHFICQTLIKTSEFSKLVI